jgi:hypothetical protein
MSKKFARTDEIIDVACVIHSDGYDWQYVQNLHNAMQRALPQGVRFHVYTEHDRSVPPHMIKHCLEDWPGVSGRKRSWWYKMHLFNPEHHAGPLLYFDLDVVIVRPMTWITTLSTDYFWACRDFRYLQRPAQASVNSSVMWFDTRKFGWLWQKFQSQSIADIVRQFPGDQDYIQHAIDHNQRRFFEDRYFQSYRWQVLDGGYDFQRRVHRKPGSGAAVAGDTAVVVFHGQPKPHQLPAGDLRTLWGG